MSPLLCGKCPLAPDLPLAQGVQIVRLILPGQIPPYGGPEIGVQQLLYTALVLFTQAFRPQRAALTVRPARPVLPVNAAGAAVQALDPQLSFPFGQR